MITANSSQSVHEPIIETSNRNSIGDGKLESVATNNAIAEPQTDDSPSVAALDESQSTTATEETLLFNDKKRHSFGGSSGYINSYHHHQPSIIYPYNYNSLFNFLPTYQTGQQMYPSQHPLSPHDKQAATKVVIERLKRNNSRRRRLSAMLVMQQRAFAQASASGADHTALMGMMTSPLVLLNMAPPGNSYLGQCSINEAEAASQAEDEAENDGGQGYSGNDHDVVNHQLRQENGGHLSSNSVDGNTRGNDGDEGSSSPPGQRPGSSNLSTPDHSSTHSSLHAIVDGHRSPVQSTARKLSNNNNSIADARAASVASWLLEWYEPKEDLSMPRSAIYEHYQDACREGTLGMSPEELLSKKTLMSVPAVAVNSATFGKIIRATFPMIGTRRLGTRGHSKYHYFGLGLRDMAIELVPHVHTQSSRVNLQQSQVPNGGSTTTVLKSSMISSNSLLMFGTSENGSVGSVESTNVAELEELAACTVLPHTTTTTPQSRTQSTSSTRISRRSMSRESSTNSGSSTTSITTKSQVLQPEGEQTQVSMVKATTPTPQAPPQSAAQKVATNKQSSGGSSLVSHNTGAIFVRMPDWDSFVQILEAVITPQLAGSATAPSQSQNPAAIADDYAMLSAFGAAYAQHSAHLCRLFLDFNTQNGVNPGTSNMADLFYPIEQALSMFWQAMPTDMTLCLDHPEVLRIVTQADTHLFNAVLGCLCGEVLEVVPMSQAHLLHLHHHRVRTFARHLPMLIDKALGPCSSYLPLALRDAKLDLAGQFCRQLRRRASLNHLSQAVDSIFATDELRTQLLRDWSQIDFGAIQEHCGWMLYIQDPLLNYIDASIKTYLSQGVCGEGDDRDKKTEDLSNDHTGGSLYPWAQWIEGLAEQCLHTEMSTAGHSLDQAIRHLHYRWALFGTQLIRDLTLRSAHSFGSFHLIKLWMDEYLTFFLEQKLDDYKRTLLSIYQAQSSQHHYNNQQGMATNGIILGGMVGNSSVVTPGHIPMDGVYDWASLMILQDGSTAITHEQPPMQLTQMPPSVLMSNSSPFTTGAPNTLMTTVPGSIPRYTIEEDVFKRYGGVTVTTESNTERNLDQNGSGAYLSPIDALQENTIVNRPGLMSLKVPDQLYYHQ